MICCDSISVNLFKLLAAGLALQSGRDRVVAVEGDFPTDRYMAQSLQWLLGDARCRLGPVPREAHERSLGDDVALVVISHVDFRSGRLEDMQVLTRLAHRNGALVVWDLAHSAGVVEVALDDCAADFAVGCIDECQKSSSTSSRPPRSTSSACWPSRSRRASACGSSSSARARPTPSAAWPLPAGRGGRGRRPVRLPGVPRLHRGQERPWSCPYQTAGSKKRSMKLPTMNSTTQFETCRLFWSSAPNTGVFV